MLLSKQDQERARIRELVKLCQAEEDWEVLIDEEEGTVSVAIPAENKFTPLVHPYQIYLSLYRDSSDPDSKLKYMKKIHDFLWPEYAASWNYWQERMFRAHCEGYKTIAVAGGAAIGKAQPLWELVLTPSGYKTMGSLQVGDTVCTPYGVSKVAQVHPQEGLRDCYSVEFSDGTSIVCDENHLWQLKRTKKPTRTDRLWTVSEIKDYLDSGSKMGKLVLPDHKPVQLEGKTVPVDPYLIGFLLGNGGYGYSSVVVDINKRDTDVLAKILYKLGELGVGIKFNAVNRGSHSLRLKNAWPILSSAGLTRTTGCNKRVPELYMLNSTDIRLEVLRGLLDSDGYITESGTIQYTSCSKGLAEDVAWLVRSLGGCAKIKSKVPIYTYNGEKKKGKRAYTVTASAFNITGLCSFKQSRIKNDKSKYKKHIVDVKYWGKEKTKCITLEDPRGLYIGDNFTVTHNSVSWAQIAVIFWLSDPQNNCCIVASTTMDSLQSRIWGYVNHFIDTAKLPISAKRVMSKPPKIVFPGNPDLIHAMLAVPIQSGAEDKVLSTLIGRHPRKRMMMILDESTDMNPSITSAIPNLEKSLEMFQLVAIGNSKSKNDLHGLLSTPKTGWKSVDWRKDKIWETAHDRGVCLYFNPYDSPAIHEKDPKKKAILSKFLMTESLLKKEERRYGVDSDAFYRFVLGFWKPVTMDNNIMSAQFLEESKVSQPAEWSGAYPLQVVAGLDPAFQVGGVGCILRLAIVGHTTSGDMVIDYRGEELLVRINMAVTHGKSGELQLAEQVIELLNKYQCPLSNLAMDATGVGRALGELLRVVSGSSHLPLKVVSTGMRYGRKGSGKTAPDIIVTSPSELWMQFREYVQLNNIRGMDEKTAAQMHNRLVTLKNGKLMLETKSEYRSRMAALNPALAHSPDEADAAILCMKAAQVALGLMPGDRRSMPMGTGASKLVMEKMAAFQHTRPLAIEQHDQPSRRIQLKPNFSVPLEELPKFSR